MPLKIGGRTPGPTDDQRLEMLAHCWIDIALLAPTFQELEAKVARQDEWLDANRTDPKWAKRVTQYLITKDEYRRSMNDVHALASRANKIIEPMGIDLRRRARREIHEWAGIGGPGVYALAWDLAPSNVWIETAYGDDTPPLLETTEVPF